MTKDFKQFLQKQCDTHFVELAGFSSRFCVKCLAYEKLHIRQRVCETCYLFEVNSIIRRK